jgi:hypothetical protein
MRPQQAECLLGPGLVAKQVDQRNQAHAGLAGGGCDGLHVRLGEGIPVRDLGVTRELVPVVEFHHQNVDAFLGSASRMKRTQRGTSSGLGAAMCKPRTGRGAETGRAKPATANRQSPAIEVLIADLANFMQVPSLRCPAYQPRSLRVSLPDLYRSVELVNRLKDLKPQILI